MNTRDILVAARKKVERPEHWTQGVLARRENGSECPLASPKAVCWCAAGAIGVACEAYLHPAYDVLEDVVGPIDIWNDAPERTHAEVLNAFDLAIERAE